ncbi:ABC transporter permease subunit [Bacillus cereus group sp. BfR-BA-01383]|uniref:ABC transporter permease subunit n=1 Tax=Bacillus cereus group sp. BfR-BA-01383 TaxID=2920327 RepID=UPI001F562B75|nr:ABC transporter permease subunit [Bacillus cereus group sp. BfR-BA-01383]
MLKKFLGGKIIEFLISIAVILTVSYLPFSLFLGNSLDFITYLEKLASPKDIAHINMTTMRPAPFFEGIIEPYKYSMSILFIATALTIVFSVGLSFVYLLVSSKIKNWIERCLILIESVPDLLLIFSLQLFVVWIYKQTGYRIITIYAFNDERAYFLPIICMTIVPTLHFFRIIVLFLMEEKNKPYVEFACAKGLSDKYILYVHLLRNIMYHLLNHLQPLFLFMISSLLMVEGAFNISGYMSFLLKPGSLNPLTMAWWILLLFVPFYILFTIVHYRVNRITGGASHEI